MLLIMNNIILKCHVFFWNFLKHVFLAKKKVFVLPARVPCLCVPPHDKKYAYSSHKCDCLYFYCLKNSNVVPSIDTNELCFKSSI